MRTSLNIQNKLTKIAEMSGDSLFQVLEFDELAGGHDIDSATKIKFMKDAKIKLRQVRIILHNSGVRTEAGALSYLKGNINMTTKFGGVVSLGKKIFTNKVTNESTFKPLYEGTGEIFLEPSFKHYALLELEDDEIIVDDGLYYASEESVEVGASMQKSISSMIFGNEGVFQTQIKGNGIVVLELPVPESEIFKCRINNDVLKVDGNFAILRTGDIEFSVEKSTKSIAQTVASGEGFLNVYRGTGEIWLAPTMSIYNKIRENNLNFEGKEMETLEESDD
ncbi:Uncharacterized conserved protein, AIM24 family [Clostridium cavendishii DSM 21758]|uniref:Uncharacterized conserved protein, AIM24 family n=1 Tax=Clostridium cavendishii DSM 21758 TaxID=1121302 RepID=A0A1M6LX93_9CLOT|nr:AIM24 family protein [Clostridium cavendishii]SHJ75796.1 Uncharacterized conserved protein, AIM24 family [Clostridium cavendishii DSM 21758]